MRPRALTVALLSTAGAILPAALSHAAGPGSRSAAAGPASLNGPAGLPAAAGQSVGREVTASLSGSLTVTFHGDPAAGCAAHGVCGYSGVIVVTGLPSRVDTLVSGFSRGGGTSYAGVFIGQGGYVAARVTSPTGVCTDGSAGPDPAEVDTASRRLRIIPVGLLSEDLTTRCAGPSGADLAAAAPSVTLKSLYALGKGRLLDLSGIRRFSSHGFSGTLRSSIVMRITDAQTVQVTPPPANPPTHDRILGIEFAIKRATGTITSSFTGAADPHQCRLLDSCGARGASTIAFAPRQGTFAVYADAGPRRPWRDLRAALGLGGRGSPRGIPVVGVLLMQGGQISETVRGCRDWSPGAFGGFELTRSGGELHASAFPLPARTSCPGPMVGYQLEAGSLPLADLGRRRLRLTLSGSAPFTDDGYTGRNSARFNLVLTRQRIVRRFLALPGAETGLLTIGSL